MTAVADQQTPQDRENLWRSMPGWGIVANLMPPELIDARRAGRIRKVVTVVASVILVIGLVGYGYETIKAHSASSALGRAQATSTELAGQQAKYDTVVGLQGEVTSLQSQSASLMAGDVDLATLVNSLTRSLLPGMTMGGVTVTLTGTGTGTGTGTAASTGGNSASSLDTSGQPHIGTISITGTALRYSDVAAYVTRLSAIKGIVAVFPQNQSAGTGGVAFSLQMTVTNAQLSDHFAAPTTGGK